MTIKLEEFTENDISQLLSWLEGTDLPFLRQFSGIRYKYPLDREQLKETISAENSIPLKAVLLPENITVGHCQIMRIDRETGTAGGGRILIAPEYRSRGYGFKLVEALKSYTRCIPGIKELELKVYDFNISALECYIRSGFQEVGSEVQLIPELHETWTVKIVSSPV